MPNGYPLHEYHQDASKEALPTGQIEELELRQAYSTHKSQVSDSIYACLTEKDIGKPCAGKPHARFDEGGLAKAVMVRLFRHRQTKGTGTDKPNLKWQ